MIVRVSYPYPYPLTLFQESVDPPLHAHIRASGVLPYFALTWQLTWHAHDLGADFAAGTRLFDLFLSSSPLMPVYVGAAAMLAARERILKAPADTAEMHRFLNALPVLGCATADELAVRALHMFRDHPPSALAKRAKVDLPKDSPVLRYPFPFQLGATASASAGGGRRARGPFPWSRGRAAAAEVGAVAEALSAYSGGAEQGHSGGGGGGGRRRGALGGGAGAGAGGGGSRSGGARWGAAALVVASAVVVAAAAGGVYGPLLAAARTAPFLVL